MESNVKATERGSGRGGSGAVEVFFGGARGSDSEAEAGRVNSGAEKTVGTEAYEITTHLWG